MPRPSQLWCTSLSRAVHPRGSPPLQACRQMGQSGLPNALQALHAGFSPRAEALFFAFGENSLRTLLAAHLKHRRVSAGALRSTRPLHCRAPPLAFSCAPEKSPFERSALRHEAQRIV